MSLQIVSGIVLGVIAIFLLTGGIMLVKKRKISATILRVWAIAYLVAGVFIAWKTMPLASQQMHILMAPPTADGSHGIDQDLEMVRNFATISAKIGLGIALTWVVICTAFVLIWFARRKISVEVKSWP